MGIKFIGWKIAIKPDNPKQYYDEQGKFVIPEAWRIQGKAGYAIYGEIVQIAEEVLQDKEMMDYLKIKVGTKVIVDRLVGAAIKIEGEDCRIVTPEDILCVDEGEC